MAFPDFFTVHAIKLGVFSHRTVRRSRLHSGLSKHLNSIWGLSLPNAWLGNLKGENLVEIIADELGNNAIADGIESLEINSNEIVIHLAE